MAFFLKMELKYCPEVVSEVPTNVLPPARQLCFHPCLVGWLVCVSEGFTQKLLNRFSRQLVEGWAMGLKQEPTTKSRADQADPGYFQ